jgi:hypothetical protein
VEAIFVVPRLEQSFGPRYQGTGGMKTILNATFWAHLVGHKTGIKFITGENVFFVEHEGNRVRLPDEAVLKIVMEILRQSSTIDSGFPTATLRPALAKQVVGEMKLALAICLPGLKETLTQFLDIRVERRNGHGLTSQELYTDYREFCHAMNRPRYLPPVFTRLIARVLEKEFGVLKSHDLERPGADGVPHSRRGFHGLTLKRQNQDQETSPDAPDAADAPDGNSQP